MVADETGLMQNGAATDAEKNTLKSETYEKDERLTFENTEDFLSFAGYYVRQYRLRNEILNGVKCNVGPLASAIPWEIQAEPDEDREAIIKVIRKTFGSVIGCKKLQKVINAATVLFDVQYDPSYIYADLDVAVSRKRMVCWQIVRTIRVLLDDAGMETECLVVRTIPGGALHSIIRWQDEEKVWHYTDPTMYLETGDVSKLDIPLSQVPQLYKPAENLAQ